MKNIPSMFTIFIFNNLLDIFALKHLRFLKCYINIKMNVKKIKVIDIRDKQTKKQQEDNFLEDVVEQNILEEQEEEDQYQGGEQHNCIHRCHAHHSRQIVRLLHNGSEQTRRHHLGDQLQYLRAPLNNVDTS